MEHELVSTVLARAQSLSRFARRSGSPISTFALALTKAEGFALLDHWVGQVPNPPILMLEDHERAHESGDPFPMIIEMIGSFNPKDLGLEGLPVIEKAMLQ